jgi:hypothetical protein
MRRRAVLVAACGLWACNPDGRERTGVWSEAQHGVSVPDPPARGAVDDATASVPAASFDGAAEWDKVTLEDAVPLCVFADHVERGHALFLPDVGTQTLGADSRVVFGTFAPGCQNEACDAPPTLQCWVDGEAPGTLVVHSRLSSEHKRGSVCTKDCHPVIAGCETEVLKAGEYTVRYGKRTFGLRIPSVMSDPCLERD